MIDARTLAFQILLHIHQKASYPDRLIRAALDRHSRLEKRDRALLTELVYGVLRHQGLLDRRIDQLSKIKPEKIDPPVRVLLRMGLYQILMLDRIPAHAAVSETVNIAKNNCPQHVVKFVNALLREAARRGDNWDRPSSDTNPAEYLAVTASHPEWLVTRFIRELGFEEASRLCEANNTVAPLSLRINTLRTSRDEIVARLSSEGLQAEPSEYLDDAVLVRAPRHDIGRTSVFEEGLIQVQDEASQLVAHLLDPQPGERILDLCAGFGGKSTHAATLMRNEGEVVCVDNSAWKLEELRANAERLGIVICATVVADALELDPDRVGTFDRVLLDAPCSGLGTLRRNPDIKWRRHPKDPYRFSLLQRDLLRRGALFVGEGGVLVYSTCTLSAEENEETARDFANAHPNWVMESAGDILPEKCRHMTEGPFFKSWPHRHGTDGFFACRFRGPVD